MSNPLAALDAVFAQLYAEQAIWAVHQRRPSGVVWVPAGQASYTHRSGRKLGDLGSRLRGAIDAAGYYGHVPGPSLPKGPVEIAAVPVYEVMEEVIHLVDFATPFGVIAFGFGPASGVLAIRELGEVNHAAENC